MTKDKDTALPYAGPERRRTPSMQKSIATSVAASLIVALIVNGITFAMTMSRMAVTLENMERRVQLLEDKAKEDAMTHKQIELKLERHGLLLERIHSDLTNISSDMKALTFKPSVQRNRQGAED